MQKYKKFSRGGKDENAVRNYAAIDLGTNSCRLVIASPTPTSFHIIETFSRITRLGEGIIKENELSREASRRTIKALKICSEIISEYAPIHRARFVATAACRRAKNCRDFLSEVKRQTGLNLEIISSQEESRLAVIGCLPLLKKASKGRSSLTSAAVRPKFRWHGLPTAVKPLSKAMFPCRTEW